MFKNIGKAFKRMFGARSSKAEENIIKPVINIVRKKGTKDERLGGENCYSPYHRQMILQNLNKIKRRRRLTRIGNDSRKINRKVA